MFTREGEKKAADRANGLSDQMLMRRQMFKSRLNALTKLEVSRRCKSETNLGALRGGPSIRYAHGANGRATAISDSRSESLNHSHNINHRLFDQKHLPIFFIFF